MSPSTNSNRRAGPRTGLALALLLLLAAACGGGGDGGSPPASSVSAAPAASARNSLPVTVDSGPSGGGNVNLLYASVTVCVPGSAGSCQDIDHVLVDTGSTGLRLLASALGAAQALPAQTDVEGNALAECALFADGYTWGSVRLADVRLAGETAASLPVQVIADAAFPTTPTSCVDRGGVVENDVASLSAKGILGLAAFVHDCGAACAQNAVAGAYYVCPAGACRPVAVALDRQVQQPVARLAVDNNGVILDLPALPAAGAATVAGTLILGIGTQANNALGNAQRLDLDAGGNFKTQFNGRTLTAFIDSGSNAYFFPDRSITVCGPGSGAAGFYCPAATLDLSATLLGAGNGSSAAVSFSVASAAALLGGNPSFSAFANLGGPAALTAAFDWGLPFFFGRRVYTAIEQRSTPGGPGPYVAF